jgi:AraC family transcriptional regulator, transcriptional activator of pobA
MNIFRYVKKVRTERRSVQFDMHTLESFFPEGNNDQAAPILQSMYTILWVQEGAGALSIDMNRFAIEQNTIYYIKPGQAFKATIHEPAKGFIISFEKEFLDLFEKSSSELNQTPLFDHFSFLPAMRIQHDLTIFLRSIAEKMLQEYRQYNDLGTEILRSFLKIFMIYLWRQCEMIVQETDISRKTELVTVFFNLLEKQFANKKRVKDYADILAVTPDYLNKTLKKTSGFTASYHIQQRIVLEAKRRAIFESDSMKEIAYTLGFGDPAHFSKFFKNSAGTNFSNFKKRAFSNSML